GAGGAPPAQTSGGALPVTTGAPLYSTSTVFTTSLRTITQCPPEVTNCPTRPKTVTDTIALYTTICPVTAAEGSHPSSSAPAGSSPSGPAGSPSGAGGAPPAQTSGGSSAATTGGVPPVGSGSPSGPAGSSPSGSAGSPSGGAGGAPPAQTSGGALPVTTGAPLYSTSTVFTTSL
ncbi:hypothetical protein ACHAQJ_010767, partial [Trichoderma viride]